MMTSKIIAAGLAVLLLLPMMGSCSDAKEKQPPVSFDAYHRQEGQLFEEESTLENAALSMTVNAVDGSFLIKDLRSGKEWRDAPALSEETESMQPIRQAELQSQLIVQYINKSEKTLVLNSCNNCVKKKGLTAEIFDGGFRMTYAFEKEGFVIPVEYRLTSDGFTADIIYQDIRQTGDNRLLSIQLLPSFDAAGMQDQGYMVVPDGSGSLIRLNNGKTAAEPYAARLYGADAMQTTVFKPTNTMNLSLPVFGMNRGGRGFLAVIEKGDAVATIHASVSSAVFPFNTVYPEFGLLATDNLTMQVVTRDIETRYVNLFSKEDMQLPFTRVRYILLPENAGYVEMANTYGDYLVNHCRVPITGQNALTLQVEFLGTVQAKKSIMGIPYTGNEILTPYEKAGEILTEIAGDWDISAIYRNWMAAGQNGKLPNAIEYNRALGGGKAFEELQNLAESSRVELFKSYELLRYQNSGNGYSKLTDSAHNILDSVIYDYPYDLAVFDKDKSVKPHVLLSPLLLGDHIQLLLKDFQKKKETNAAFLSIGSLLYSDYSGERSTDREQAKVCYEQALSAAAGQLKRLMVYGPAAYALQSATDFSDVPMNSSGFDITDESIPFLQIALRGIKNLASMPVNLQGDARKALLRCLEYGVTPSFTLAAENVSTLMNSEQTEYYSVEAAAWLPFIREYLEESAGFFQAVDGHRIVRHEEAARDVFFTEYDNGVRVLVNYGGETAVYEGRKVEAAGYIILGGNAA